MISSRLWLNPTFRTSLGNLNHFCVFPEFVYNRVHLDLWYPWPPTTGGHSHGHVTVRRPPDPPSGGPGFDQSHRGRVAAVGAAL